MRNVQSAVAARAGGAANGARRTTPTRRRTAPMERDRMETNDETRVISMWRRRFRGAQHLASAQERGQCYVDGGEGLLAALLAVHDRDDVGDVRAVSANPIDRPDERPARRHDVLDEDNTIAGLEVPLEIFRNPVLLPLLRSEEHTSELQS